MEESPKSAKPLWALQGVHWGDVDEMNQRIFSKICSKEYNQNRNGRRRGGAIQKLSTQLGCCMSMITAWQALESHIGISLGPIENLDPRISQLLINKHYSYNPAQIQIYVTRRTKEPDIPHNTQKIYGERTVNIHASMNENGSLFKKISGFLAEF